MRTWTRRGWIAFGALCAALLVSAGDARAQNCILDCNGEFRGCLTTARTELLDCRSGCDDRACTSACVSAFQDERAECDAARVSCLGECPPPTCRSDCGRAFGDCVRMAAETFRSDCLQGMCLDPFLAARRACDELAPEERRDCVLAARDELRPCIEDCRTLLTADREMCSTERDACLAACGF